MDEATKSADQIRQQIQDFRKKYVDDSVTLDLTFHITFLLSCFAWNNVDHNLHPITIYRTFSNIALFGVTFVKYVDAYKHG